MLNLKALIVVLASAWIVFALAKPICLRFTAAEDFSRRRTVWFLLTIAAFLSPTFWLYLLIAAPLVAWAAYKDSTPAALYLFLYFVIPPVSVAIPTVLINQLFDLSNARLLALVVLLPAVWRRVASSGKGDPLRLDLLDVALLLFGTLQLALLIPYESPTNTMRRAFLFLLDTYLVYFAFSRLLRERRDVADTMGAFCLAIAIFAPIAVFESLRGWLLYTGVLEAWGQSYPGIFLLRGDALRAQAAAGHALTLGYLMAMVIGFWMYLQSTEPSKKRNAAFFCMMSIGLFFTYSRGPWVAGVIAVLIALVLGSRSAVQIVKVISIPIAVMTTIIASPFGSRFIDLLPFIGSTGLETINQRQRLAETSWRLVQENPLFGNPFVLLQMEELRNGQNGIIDLMNAYAQVALFYGLVGLGLFLVMFLGALRKSYSTLRVARADGDADMVWMGASLVASMVASLFLMATAGHLRLEWVFAGILVGYASLKVSHAQTATSFAYENHARQPFRTSGLTLRR